MLLKLFQNWSGGFGVIPIFHFFETKKNLSFLKLSRETMVPFSVLETILTITGNCAKNPNKYQKKV